MAPNHGNNCALIETEARNLAHRLGDILRCTCTCDHTQCEPGRERLEHEAGIAALNYQVADLTSKLKDAQLTIRSLTTAQATLTRVTDERNALRDQVKTLNGDLHTSREANTNLKIELDQARKLAVDAHKEAKTYKDKCTLAEREVTCAKLTGKEARKKMKQACSLLKDDEDISYNF
ncbi:hypothetical protein MPER_03708 [Moniliophthora perniciosa FA553]|nr:hypothetical protein MPER_03708 [Moniliophthora perniciosa FA553]